MKRKLSMKNIIEYLKIACIAVLVVIEIVVCARAFTPDFGIAALVTLAVCCFALAVLETINAFAVTNFIAKMVFFGVESVLLLVVCILTGNAFLSTLYCVVLTQYYISVERFKDKTVLYCVSCALYTVSFIVGWIIRNPEAPVLNGLLEVSSGALFGLLAITLDYIVAMFLIKFYRTNLELSAALKDADEKRVQLEKAYEQLTQTRVFEERNRIAKDIHDNAGHSMTTVIMQTEAAKLLIDENPAEAKNRIISANLQARNALEQMRESVHLLAGRPQTQSLREEIEEIIAQTVDGTDIKARCDVSDVSIGDEVYRFIVNSVKELLANGIRHGGATAFYIELKEFSGNITLLVSDNGSGVKGDICEGFGLKGLREKAEQLGGGCRFTSEEGEGFEAEITLPVSKTKNNLSTKGEEIK